MLQRVKVDAHAYGVGFYSYIAAKVIPNTTESVDEVLVHVFLLSILKNWTGTKLLQ